LKIVTEKIQKDEQYAVNFFNQLFEMDLPTPGVSLKIEQNVPGAFVPIMHGDVYEAAPGIQKILT
jgi:hypothetical protein